MPHFNYKKLQVFYQIIGKGKPIMLLHGNTASSAMFDSFVEDYAKHYQVILIDFPGHGKSDRLTEFKTDFWHYNAQVCYALIEELKLENISVVGTSGGALVAINLALEHPDKIDYVIADSFEGEYPLESYMASLKKDRAMGKQDPHTQAFWQYCHGDDWEKIVDLDTEMLLRFSDLQQSFFHQKIAQLKVPTLLTGSRKDEFCDHLEDIYLKMQKRNQLLEIHLFEEGFHPAMLSNAAGFLKLIQSKI